MKIYNYELRFGLLQTAKILNHNGYNNMKQILWSDVNTKVFLQKTSIFSYYILKTVLLNNINTFLDCNLEIRSLMVNNGSYRNVENILLDILLRSNILYKNVDKIITDIKKSKVLKSLRMSIL